MTFKQFALVVVTTFIASCGPAEWEGMESERNDVLDPNGVECQKSTSTGCIQGQVAAAPDILIDGKRYFDAETFVNTFADSLAVSDAEGTALQGKEVALTWNTLVDNRNFAEDFSVFVKGHAVKSGFSSKRGNFAVDRLPAGEYEIRAQKTFKFTLAYNKVIEDQPTNDEPRGDVSTEGEDEREPQIEVVSKEFCLILFAEDSLEVRKDMRTGMVVFDSFQSQVSECAKADGERNETELTL